MKGSVIDKSWTAIYTAILVIALILKPWWSNRQKPAYFDPHPICVDGSVYCTLLKRQWLLLLSSQFHVINIPTKFYNCHIVTRNVRYLIAHVGRIISSSLSLKSSPKATKKLFRNVFTLECATFCMKHLFTQNRYLYRSTIKFLNVLLCFF